MFQGAKMWLAKLKADRLIAAQRFELGLELASTNAGALSVITPVSVLTTGGGGETRTLANGYPGQVKILFMMTDGGGDCVVTPANLYNGNTITFADVNDSWIGIFYNGQWHTISGVAAVSVLA